MNHKVSPHPLEQMGLSEQAAFLNSVLESSTEYSIVAKDLDGRILAWNEGARRIYGYEHSDVVGRSAFILHDPEDVQTGRPRGILDEALREGKWSGALVRVRKNGSKFRAFVTVTLRRDSLGAATGFTMISRDLTESERIERELRESQEYNRGLIESNMSSAFTDERDRALAARAGASTKVVKSPTLTPDLDAVRAALSSAVPEPHQSELEQSQYLETVRRQLDRQAALNRTLVHRAAIHSAALSLIGALSEAFEQPAQMQGVLADVLVHCLDAAGLSSGLLYVCRSDGSIELLATSGVKSARRAGIGRALEIIEASQSNNTSIVALSRADKAKLDHRAALDALDRQSALLVPLRMLNERLGRLVLASDDHDLSDPTWLAFARTLAAEFGQALALARTVEHLANSEQRYRELFGSTPIAMFVCRPETLEICDANQAALERYRYSRDELLARRLTDLHPPSDRPYVQERLTSGISTLTRAGDWKHCTRDGSMFEVELLCNPISAGTPALLVIAHDVSERKRAEALFRAAVDVSPNGLLMADRNGTIQLANRQMQAMFGYSEAELLGRPVEMLLPAPLAQSHVEHRASFHQRSVPRGMGSGRELFALHKDGHPVPVEIGLSPALVAGNEIVVASITDVTERRQAEQSVKDSAARWQALMDGAMDGVSLVRHDGIIVEANERMAAILGVARDEIVGRHVSDFSDPLDLAATNPAFERAATKGSGFIKGANLRRADGSTAIVDFALNTVQVGSQRLLLSIGRDVTDQRQLEQQYRQAQKMEAVGRLAGGVAHDFNNMLTAILGYAELIEASVPPNSPIAEDVAEIQSSAMKAAGLTKQLLAFSRQQVMTRVVLNPNAVITELQKLLARLIGEDVNIELHLDPAVHNVLADRGQLEQVLMNLAVNSRDAMPGGGTLTIESADVDLTEDYTADHASVEPGRYVMIAVTDTGTGMSDEIRARVFEPFFTTKEVGAGTGLGLATAYGIVKQSGGFIYAYSEPGRGATFKVYLPIVERAEEPRKTATPTTQLRGTETIILAEDDRALRELATNVLKHYGYRVLAASNPDDAVRLSRSYDGKVHLLLTDMIMPGGNGASLALRIQEERPDVRLLFMSGYTDVTFGRQGGMPEGSAFIQKPFTPGALAHRIREVLDQSEPADA